ncbi:MAG: bifunctional glutamate N-acetyltransferase/amino-acid acetyltransferase ArgJ [Pseudomonadales bacterium]
MAVNIPEMGSLEPVPGIRLGTAQAGIKKPGRDDVALLVLDEGTTVAGVFTRNSFRAAPVLLAESRFARGGIRAFLINSGNANAATGEPGLADAKKVCAELARSLGVAAEAVAPFSTGVIGERLPVDRMVSSLPAAVKNLGADNWAQVARAIMTTDTVPKALSRQAEIGGVKVTVTGMVKGAGMIKPDMATMLAFVGCDAQVARPALESLVREVADVSFNRISIDGDTSTNDCFVIAATGQAGNSRITSSADGDYRALRKLLTEVCQELAQRVVRDGEGATRFVTVNVTGGANQSECLRVAYTIAESPLVKTALFAGDPNWGRLSMAIGRAGVEDLDTTGVNVHLAEVCVMRGGLKAAEYTEAAGAAVMARDEFEIRVELGRGDQSAMVWTTDLSYEYVKINAEYRS